MNGNNLGKKHMDNDHTRRKLNQKVLIKTAALLMCATLFAVIAGSSGIGGFEAVAANSSDYPSEPDPGDTISIVDDNTYVVFCMYSESAEILIDDFTGDGYPGTGGNQTELFHKDEGDEIEVPETVAGATVAGWDLYDVMTIDGCTLVTYEAIVSTTVRFVPDGYEADGDSVDMDSPLTPGGDPVEMTVEGTWSLESNMTDITLKGANTFSYDGYTLVGWRDSESDSLSYYSVGGTASISRDSDTVVFNAVWERDKTIEVIYRPGEGTGSNITEVSEWQLQQGGDFKSFSLLSSADFTRTGYELAGWVLAESDGAEESSNYELGDTCVIGANTEGPLVFDAVWHRLPKVDVTLEYRPNGGNGDAITDSKTLDLNPEDGSATVTLLDKADFNRNGYILNGWTDGSTTYALGANLSFTVEEDELSKALVLDAVWKEKKEGEVNIEIKKPAYLGAKIQYDVKENSGGDVDVEFKKRDAGDSAYSTSLPTEPGKYTARAKLEETDEYTSDEDDEDFEIICLDAPTTPYTYQEVKNSDGTVTDLNIVPADGYEISISQKEGFGASVSYLKAKTTGVYVRRDRDKAITAKIDVKSYTAADTPTITPPAKVYYGTAYEVKASSLSPATKTVKYKRTTDPDSAYTENLPTEPGEYNVRMTAPATEFYKAVDHKGVFSIDYLEDPETKATVKGSNGQRGWFVSDVTITAPEGYLISTDPKNVFSDSLEWDPKVTKLYYQRTEDGAITNAVAFDADVRIDPKAPKASYGTEFGPKIPENNGSIDLFVDSVSFTLEDDNLYSVTVNGESCDFSGKTCTVELKAGKDTEVKTIIATDEAGNKISFTVVLSPAWMSTNTMPVGKPVTLRSNICYKLEGGSNWKINGDDTVYFGGNDFYVKKNGDFTFEKQE